MNRPNIEELNQDLFDFFGFVVPSTVECLPCILKQIWIWGRDLYFLGFFDCYCNMSSWLNTWDKIHGIVLNNLRDLELLYWVGLIYPSLEFYLTYRLFILLSDQFIHPSIPSLVHETSFFALWSPNYYYLFKIFCVCTYHFDSLTITILYNSGRILFRPFNRTLKSRVSDSQPCSLERQI